MMTFGYTSDAGIDGVKVLAYSLSGMGKTMLCATAPAPIIISVESGLLALRKSNIEQIFGINTPGICYNIPVIHITTMEDFKNARLWLEGSHEARQFQTVCIDSITECAERVLCGKKLSNKDPRKAYGEMLDQMVVDIKAFRDLPGKNVYMSAKMEASKDEMSGMVKWGPMMPGQKLGPQLPYLFDEVFRLGVGQYQTAQGGQKYRYLQTEADPQFDAKDRSGALDSIEQPNLTHIFNKILGVI